MYYLWSLAYKSEMQNVRGKRLGKLASSVKNICRNMEVTLSHTLWWVHDKWTYTSWALDPPTWQQLTSGLFYNLQNKGVTRHSCGFKRYPVSLLFFIIWKKPFMISQNGSSMHGEICQSATVEGSKVVRGDSTLSRSVNKQLTAEWFTVWTESAQRNHNPLHQQLLR